MRRYLKCVCSEPSTPFLGSGGEEGRSGVKDMGLEFGEWLLAWLEEKEEEAQCFFLHLIIKEKFRVKSTLDGILNSTQHTPVVCIIFCLPFFLPLLKADPSDKQLSTFCIFQWHCMQNTFPWVTPVRKLLFMAISQCWLKVNINPLTQSMSQRKCMMGQTGFSKNSHSMISHPTHSPCSMTLTFFSLRCGVCVFLNMDQLRTVAAEVTSCDFQDKVTSTRLSWGGCFWNPVTISEGSSNGSQNVMHEELKLPAETSTQLSVLRSRLESRSLRFPWSCPTWCQVERRQTFGWPPSKLQIFEQNK